MASTATPSGRNPAGPAVIVHEAPDSRVTRLVVAGQSLIRKEPLGPDGDRRLQHEEAMLRRLRGVTGVAQLAEKVLAETSSARPGSLMLADAGEVSLASVATPLAVQELAGLGLGLAKAVAGMHRRGVMHRNICPANIVVGPDGAPCLVGFASATSVAEIRPEFTHHGEIVGTLPYLAPEQTGRTGRSVDERADLYALGATLYELATGAPPFGSGDPLRLIHDLLTRVPAAPDAVNPAVPAPLSEIILHLLEKEPDHRYQTAEGVLYDLERVPDAGPAGLRVGARDAPLRLVPPSRLVGRDPQVAALAAALDDAVAGRCQGVLVGGVPGVGKTALVDQLRSVVTARDGWFVVGKFDQYRRDLEFDGVYQALRALGRLLLAEPEEELAEVRQRIHLALGPNAGLAAVVVPEFAALLAVPPDPGYSLTAQARVQWAAVQVLRVVASRKRPVLLFIDDLQWAGRTPLGVVDLVLREEPVEGLLLVGAHREVDAAHPLATSLARWREQAGVRQLELADLPVPDVVSMVAEMLHLEGTAAADLAGLIAPHTRGNPHETVETLNALRRDGVLTATAGGWRWHQEVVRAYLDTADPARLFTGRAEALPAWSRRMVQAMACLGGRAELSLLHRATGAAPGEVERCLAPALDDGLLVAEASERAAVRFRHDRIREAVLAEIDPPRRRRLQLAMARRLAEVPELFAVAAEQYLAVIDAVTDTTERRQVVALLRHAADQAALIGDPTLVSTLLAATLRLVDPDDSGMLVEVHTDRHAALFSLGRLDEADDEYRMIDRLAAGAVERANATAVQMSSLVNRARFTEALALGLDALGECGITVPDAERLPDALDDQFQRLYRWLDTDPAEDQGRPDTTDPTLLAATSLINTIVPAAFYDPAMYTWLALEALRIWIEHGPGPTVIGPAGHTAFAVIVQREDYAAGHRTARRLLSLGEARGYEPGTSQTWQLLSVLGWTFEPLTDLVHAAQRARAGLIAEADLAYASYTFYSAAAALLDCAPSLDIMVAEVETGLAFVRRTGSGQIGQWIDSYRWLVAMLRGETNAGAALPLDSYADNPIALFLAHVNQALAAAIFGDPGDLLRHTTAAMPLRVAGPCLYSQAVVRLLRGLALAETARDGDLDERAGLLSELDEMIRWLAARAAATPDNFRHLVQLLEAERAWAVGDFRAAVLAFDAARHEADRRERPWHRGLIAERAARFFIAHGVERTGRELLVQARQTYAAWGATAKVAHLDWAYPTVRPVPDATTEPGVDQSTVRPPGRTHDTNPAAVAVTSGTIDLLGILSASQALSSETTIDRLHARVAAVLGAMTGATSVRLLLWSDEHQDWLLPRCGSGDDHEHVLPMSVLRYAHRTREPLVVADATADDRFARDPYFTGAPVCSVLAVPILSRGKLRALLLLENRLIRSAFTTNRLDAVTLIAGQLAVSLDNAQLYADLATSRARIVATADHARRRIERDLHDGAQQRLVSIVLQIRAVQAAVPPELGALAAKLNDVAAEATGALDELREIAHGIHPSALTTGGLRSALRALARRARIPVDLHMPGDQRLPEPVEISAYYLIAEALTNTVKHAHASTVRITVETDTTDAVLRLRVQDDGVGGADLTRGTGLLGLKDRVEALGGRIHLDSPPGAGTDLHAHIPLAAPRSAG